MSFWKKKSKSDEYLAEAKKYERRGEFDRAGDYFIMGDAPDRALAMYEKGGHHQLAAQLLEKLGENRRAAEHYAQARNWRAAAAIYDKLGEKKRASQLFERLGEYYKAAEIEESLKSYERAAELYIRAGQRDRAASAYARNRDYATAAKVMEEFLAEGGLAQVKDKAERQWARCADLHTRAGDHAIAADILERIHRPLEAARAYEQGGEVAKAIELFLKAGDPDRAAELHGSAPDGSIPPEVLAELFQARGQWAEAAELFRELSLPARAAECFDRSGDRRAAAEQYELDGELELAAEMFYAAGDFARASELYEGALRGLSAARAAEKAGDAERAARLFTDAGEGVDAARCWTEAGQAEQAIAVLQELPASHEKYLEACVKLGDAFRAKGLGSIAREKYEVATADRSIDGSTLPAYYGLALLNEESGDRDGAISILERILATDFSYKDAAERLEALRLAHATVGAGAPSDATMPGMGSGETRIMAGDSSSGSSAFIGGRYELVGRLASSPRGDVYKAWDTSLGRTVVLKRLVPEDEDEGQAHRYVHEAQQASKLHHSNIAAIYDAVEQPEGRLVAMEYIFGKSLREVLRGEGHLTPGRAIEIANQVLLALEYAHEAGVTHRNLRPENVLIAEKANVKLTDFGMNRRFGDVNKDTYDGTSPMHYMSPEQIRGEKIDHRADLYAVGCLLYEMLLGRAPFVGVDCAKKHLEAMPESLSAQDSTIPTMLETIVLQCLEKDRNQRYNSARQVFDALRSFDLMPGQRIADRYELLREIGSGGMGRVYLAKDLELEETIAMKVLRPEFSTDAKLEQRFIREIKLARKIGHESVVKVFDFGKWNDLKFITMEFIDGISLDEYVRRRGRPDAVEVAKLMVQICDALQAAHRIGVIHRDIKPQNVLISPEGAAKIVDFGIARLDQHEDLTSSRHIIGSPKYMSPEQIQGKDVDHRTDVYAIGVVLYYCFTGLEPFAAADTNAIIMKQLREMPTPPTQINTDLPPWTDMVVLRCLAKDPAARYQSAAEVAAALRAEI